jgi:hypothetical protein
MTSEGQMFLTSSGARNYPDDFMLCDGGSYFLFVSVCYFSVFLFIVVFAHIREVARQDITFDRVACLSVRGYRTIYSSLERFPWDFRRGSFTQICRNNSSLSKVETINQSQLVD